MILGLALALAATACKNTEPSAPRTQATRPLSPLGPYPNLSSVPPRPAPPTPGVVRAEETDALAADRGDARDADRAVRESGPVPPPPVADSIRPNFALLGGADALANRRRASNDRSPQTVRSETPAAAVAPAGTSAAAEAPPVQELPGGPIEAPVAEPPAPFTETAQGRLAVRPSTPPEQAETTPAEPAGTQRPADPARSQPALAIRFRINSAALGAGGLARLDGFAQQWAASGRGRIMLAARRQDDLAEARQAAVIDGLKRAGVPADAIATGRITTRAEVVELWRE